MDVDQASFMDDKMYEAAREKGNGIPSSIDNDELFLGLTPGDQSNVFHIAAQHGNKAFINAALIRFPTHHYHLLCKQNSKGDTPLHIAAQFGEKNTVEALLVAHDGHGVPFDIHKKPCWSERNKQGDTPLHTALRYGHGDIAMLLLGRDRELVSLCNDVGESPAYLAAESFCHTFLERILDGEHYDQSSVSFSGPFGMTVFHPARRLTKEIMSILIERRKRLLRAQDNNGKTVLHYAVEEKSESTVEILLKADSSLAYLYDNDGLTPLHKAAKKGFFSMIQTILRLSPQSIEIRDKCHGQTTLHLAKMDAYFLEGCLKKTRMNELINQVDNDGNTPLHLALMNSEVDAANKMMKVGGINWRLKNKEGYSPIDLCKSDDQIPIKLKCLASAWKVKEVAKIDLLSHRNDLLDEYTGWDKSLTYEGDSLIHIAAREGHMGTIEKALESNFSRLLLISGENSKGETPLHLAAEYGHFEVVNAILSQCISTNKSPNYSSIVQVIIENGADNQLSNFKPWRLKSENGDTPAHKAVRNRHAKIALLLLRLEPELASLVNMQSESLLYLAVNNRCIDVLEEILLESRGYPFSISGPHGQNLLHAAARNAGFYICSCVIKLIQRQPDLVKKVDDKGKTPLHHAAIRGEFLIVEELLKHDKSTAFVYDDEGFTPLLRAAQNGCFLTIKAILNCCPSCIHLRDICNNRTVLHFAKMSRDLSKCMKHQDMANLINETDRDGNTPLHCAILDTDVNKAVFLLKAKGVNWRIRNKQHQRPLDLCKQLMSSGNDEQLQIYTAMRNHRDGNQILIKIRLAIMKIIPAIVRIIRQGNKTKVGWIVFSDAFPGWRQFSLDLELMSDDQVKQLLNNIAVVAALLVTLNFTASFYVPGGYDNKTGEAILRKLPSFRMFMHSAVAALLASVMVLIPYTFSLGTNGVNKKVLARFSFCFLQVSIFATLLCYTFGVSMIMDRRKSLRQAVLLLFVGVVIAVQYLFLFHHIVHVATVLSLDTGMVPDHFKAKKDSQ